MKSATQAILVNLWILLSVIPAATTERVYYFHNDEEVEVWLKDQIDLLKEILDGIYASESIESTAAHLIALDAILPYQLACLVKARLR